MSDELKPCLLADVEWLHLGSTNEYKDVKKFIADICYDVARAACIDEICINDICVGFRQRGYEVIAKCDLDALRAELAAKDAEIERLRIQYDLSYERMEAEIENARIANAEIERLRVEIEQYDGRS